ncbi:MAG: antibiotic resistance protein MarC [Chloroflexi bacterium HGW-Chloroflexi-6]|nr:MAG: antibiotic resistance protein MarC [Chloroflexi bacterium HGW-Chloroflexi-6]
MFEFALLAFASLFTMVNPIGVIPVYTAMTSRLTPQESHKVAIKAVLTAFIILMLFALTGRFIFQFFGISANSLRVVGGVIFFIMGYELLQARLTRTQFDNETTQEYASDIAITPLGIPVICGPGAIASVIILMDQAKSALESGIVLGAIIVIMGMTHLLLLASKQVMKLIGENGNKLMMRLMGLIVMVIAVEFFFSGLKPILRDILMIQ